MTEAAAIASARTIGRRDPLASDQAAVDAMRRAFDSLDIDGLVVIGEGERDRAPMLHPGERVGRRGPQSRAVDIALDPLEGTELCANNKPGALCIVAFSQRGGLMSAPDLYMEKLCVGPAARGVVALDASPADNVMAIARAQGRKPSELTVVVMDRPRHLELIANIERTGAKVKLIDEGDVAACISTSLEGGTVDAMMGVGGAPEGVISAAAMQCLGGEFQGRLLFRDEAEWSRAREFGIRDRARIYRTNDLAHGEISIAATGVTSGELLRGVHFSERVAETHSLLLSTVGITQRFVTSRHATS